MMVSFGFIEMPIGFMARRPKGFRAITQAQIPRL
jgi:hypothetical protein